MLLWVNMSMYVLQDAGGENRLRARGSEPNLQATDRFWRVIETLPDDSHVPAPLVKFGLLTRQLSPVESDVRVELSRGELFDAHDAVVPPKTLAAVRRLLVELVDELPDEERELIGAFCAETGLNQPPAAGASSSAVTQTAANQAVEWETIFSRERSETGAETLFASGKRITTRGGERVTGKNPFADADRLKDTGLHQAGG
jgi:hypothetical protein